MFIENRAIVSDAEIMLIVVRFYKKYYHRNLDLNSFVRSNDKAIVVGREEWGKEDKCFVFSDFKVQACNNNVFEHKLNQMWVDFMNSKFSDYQTEYAKIVNGDSKEIEM